MELLYHKLLKYAKDNYYPMHMPGHKRNINLLKFISKDMDFMGNPFEVDITEIDGFDNLHDAEGILKEAMERGARVYHSEHTYFLVNGSTGGILAGIAACTHRGDKILMARNCHKSVYNGVFLNELRPVYIYPQLDMDTGLQCGISPDRLEYLLIKNQDVKLVVITSPTYEGVVSDIGRIAKIVHSYGIPLMVDEAHGAHFGHSPYFPVSSVMEGADLVIHSVHKTLPAFTQTALIHVNGSIVDNDKVKKFLSIYQSSSPSYILIAGIDGCMELLEKKGISIFEEFNYMLKDFYNKIKQMKHLRIFVPNNYNSEQEVYVFDFSKITILTNHSSISGRELYDILLMEYKIQMELVSKDYVLAITSIGDTKEGFDKLAEALITIDSIITKENSVKVEKVENIFLHMAFSPFEAYNKISECVLLENSQNRISKEYIYMYPPGIPIVVPGEVLNGNIIERIKEYREAGLMLKGLVKNSFINVVIE